MNKSLLVDTIKASTGKLPCDFLIKNITIIDVFNKRRFINSVAIKDGYIVGIGKYKADTIIDGTGKFICPSLIDSHCHIESSFVTPDEYYKIALLNGITSAIADPHEIANVMGVDGIKFMLKSSKNIPFDMFFMLPSCVPGTNFEDSGAVLNAEDLKEFYNNKKVLGLAEVMNYPALSNTEDSMIDKIYDAISNNKIIDGHGAGFTFNMNNSYRTAHIETDHESISKEEALSKISLGMNILIRQGTAAKNLKELFPAINQNNSSRFAFCTDDMHIDDILKKGSINSSIKYCIKNGLSPETSISIGSYNGFNIYGLKNRGAIAPGYRADFIILNDLNNFVIDSVYKDGNLVVKNGKLINISSKNSTKLNLSIPNSINIKRNLTKEDLQINITNKSKLNAIKLIPNKLETKHLSLDITDDLKDKFNNDYVFKQSTKRDLLKITVIERHKATGKIGTGILNGLLLKRGAIGTTIAHDSHNIIIVGTNDNDMIAVQKQLSKIGGGLVIIDNEKVIASLPLQIGGLMTNLPFEDIKEKLNNIHTALNYITDNADFDIFLTMSFLSLPVIPSLRITDKGLFDVQKFKFIDTAF
ncbi:adenine deaminase [Clostridium sp. BJN0001]|uniref:adenine deaminase n=1 Tax=Clostridium sp. BJN0001 TaxID=2930219 RepID=UPI001FD048FF|nr:adenine deaminase [Clostridium sp. BJN0001]